MKIAASPLIAAIASAQSQHLAPVADPAVNNLPAQKIGPDDSLSVSVYDSPELTCTVRVGVEALCPNCRPSALTHASFSRQRAGIRRRPLRLPHRIFFEIFAVLRAVLRALRVSAVKLLAIAVVFSPASSMVKGTHPCVTF